MKLRHDTHNNITLISYWCTQSLTLCVSTLSTELSIDFADLPSSKLFVFNLCSLFQGEKISGIYKFEAVITTYEMILSKCFNVYKNVRLPDIRLKNYDLGRISA